MSKPIAWIDTETTGVDLEKDRIVEFGVIVTNEFLKPLADEKRILVNPGIPIPKEATDVHGITDEMVRDKPGFINYAKSLATYMGGCDIGGFNILNFDIPLLAEEFERAGVKGWPGPDTVFIDAYIIFREKEKRDLTGAVKFYMDADHGDSHNVLGDIRASIDVFASQKAKYADILEMDRAQLAAFCCPEPRLDLAGKIVLNDKGVAVYGFGKDKGKSVKANPGFGVWMLKQNFTENTKREVRKLLGYGGGK